MPKERLIIANCGGFWGDDPTAARRQVEGGPIDYLVMDYLAEVTMAILQKAKEARADSGWAIDFLVQLKDVLKPCVEKGITIISNAGGVNPLACKAAVEKLAKDLGIADKVKVGVVMGDDIYPELDGLLAAGHDLKHMDTGRPLADVRKDVLSANVYLGAAPIVKALEMGANVIVAGRVTDTAVTLAPMIHEFGWAHDDWDKLAAGIVAGHIIECGAQCTGGNFSDWHLVQSYARMGYPIVEARPDGTFVVTKHPDTGGLVSVHTIAEQLVYEMGSPAYIAPDCVARFDSIQLRQEGPNRVHVSGIRGAPAPEKLKVSVSFAQGHRCFGRLVISGPRTLDKARRAADAFWESVGGRDAWADSVTQIIGWDACHPPLSEHEPGEVIVQLAVRDADENRINKVWAPQLVPKVLGTVPGITYLADQGRPKATAVVGYWPALIGRDPLKVKVRVGDREESVSSAVPTTPGRPFEVTPPKRASVTLSGKHRKVPLSELCLARSGDKGDTANVGVIARSPAIYDWIRHHLTAETVRRRFAEVCRGKVERFELPNLLGLNFLLHESLGGGGTLSLLLDAQGKTFAQFLLATEVEVDASLLEKH